MVFLSIPFRPLSHSVINKLSGKVFFLSHLPLSHNSDYVVVQLNEALQKQRL